MFVKPFPTYIKRLIPYLLFLVFNLANAQDVAFSQFYTARTYLNPAFSALSNGHIISTSYRNQWPSIQKSYNSNLVSYSRSLDKSGAGISCYFLNDIAGVGSLRKQTYAAQYAKRVRIGKNIYGSLGLRGSYNVNSINWGKLKWGDMIDSRKGFVYSTDQPVGLAKTTYFDMGSGLIIYSDKFHVGAVMEHINKPKISLLSISESSKMLIRYKLHLGGNFKLQSSPTRILVNISPQLIYMSQGENKQVSIGTYLDFGNFKSKSKLVIGAWCRLNDSFIFLVGVQEKKYRIGYSFDLGINKLISHSGGAHELSITYSFEFKNKNKRRKVKAFDCSYF